MVLLYPGIIRYQMGIIIAFLLSELEGKKGILLVLAGFLFIINPDTTFI